MCGNLKPLILATVRPTPTNINRNTFASFNSAWSVAADWRHVLASFVCGGGRNFGTLGLGPQGPRMGAPSLHKGEQDALQKLPPPSVVVPPDQLSKEFNTKQRDEPDEGECVEAVNKPPAGAPSSGARNAPPPARKRASQPAKSVKRGETNASPWRQPRHVHARDAVPDRDAQTAVADRLLEDKAALAAVAHRRQVGRSARRHELKQGLDAAGPSEPGERDDGTRLQLSGRPRGEADARSWLARMGRMRAGLCL